jgi:hypothetical protein
MPAGRLCILDYLTLLPSADDPLGTMPARRLRILDTLSAAQARRPLLPSMPAGRLGIPDVGNVLSMPAKGLRTFDSARVAGQIRQLGTTPAKGLCTFDV